MALKVTLVSIANRNVYSRVLLAYDKKERFAIKTQLKYKKAFLVRIDLYQQ